MTRSTPEIKTHFRTCHLCETMCGIAIDYRGDEVLSIRGDKDHDFSYDHDYHVQETVLKASGL